MANAQLQVDILTTMKKVAGAAAVIKFAKDIVSAASDAEQSMGAVDAVFKTNSDTIKGWAANSASALGLAGNDYRDLAVLIGTQLKAAGTSMNDLAPETNKLIELGSDLAAQFGGTTKEAVEALSSAMKGELNPIEKYGVSLSQTRLAAKAASMGLGDLWKAGDAATKQQVLMAAIMEQSADALGANAREADTAQGKWNRLAASFEDAKVRMGGALLPAFQSLMDILNSLLPVIEPIITSLAGLVSAVAKLPAPVLLGVAAMATFLVKSGGIASAFKGWTSGATSFGSAMKGVGKSLAMGGAIGVAAVGLGLIIQAFTDAAKRAEESRKRVSELTDALVESSGKWTENATKVQQAQVEQSKEFQTLTAAGVSYGDAMDFLTGKTSTMAGVTDGTIQSFGLQGQAVLSARDAISAEAEAAKKSAAEKIAYAEQQKVATKAINVGTAALNVGTAALAAFGAMTDGTTADLVAMDGPVQDVGDALTSAGAAMKSAAREAAELAASNTGLSKSLSATDAAASDAKRALDFLQVAIDAISGRNRTAEQATADFNSSLLEMAEAATKAKDEGGLNTAALKSWNVAALTATSSGQGVYKALDQAASSYTAVTSAAYSNTAATKGTAAAQKAARAAADTARASFIKQATAMVGNSADATKLANKLGILEGKKLTNKTFDVIGKDAKAQATLRAVANNNPKDKSFDVKADASQAKAALTKLKNTAVADKVQKILGNGADAQAKVQAIRALGIPDKYAHIIAQANNLGSAQAAIRQVANGNYTAVINVATAGVQAALSAVRNIISNVTGRSAAIASGGGARMAPMAAPAVAGYSTMSARSSRAATPPGPSAFTHGIANPLGGNIIVVNGALDPDRVARQINGYVTARARRTGPVTLGHSVLAV